MKQDTVYLKVAQISERYEPDVYIKDIAEVYCADKTVEAKVKAMKVTSFHLRKEEKKKVAVYIGSVLELLRKIEQTIPNVRVDNLGQVDFIIKYRPEAGETWILQWFKTAFISLIAFCGAAFAIMTFNNDSSVSDVFANIYYLTMGVESDGVTILEFSYCIGLALGILVFFNHFAKWKLTVDPTPIEVEMRLYEDNLNKTIIQNHGRKERGIDVS